MTTPIVVSCLTPFLLLLLSITQVLAQIRECSQFTIDFESTMDGSPLTKGNMLDKSVKLPGGVTFMAQRRHDSNLFSNYYKSDAMIFDSTMPTGNDNDLAQSPDLANILIISEDNDSNDTDDNYHGGQIMGDFPMPMKVHSITMIDIQDSESKVELLASDGTVMKTVSIPPTPDGGVVIVDLTSDDEELFVSGIRLELKGSGAIDNIVLTPECKQVDLPDHCEQRRALDYSLVVQELQSPPGPRHSDGIVLTEGNLTAGTSLGLVYFSNDLVVPEFGAPMGTQTGHCVQVFNGQELACYFNFNIKTDDLSGRFTAEALFDLVNFPNANLIITGGTGDFRGIVGDGCTTRPETVEFDGTTFIYTFNYNLVGY